MKNCQKKGSFWQFFNRKREILFVFLKNKKDLRKIRRII